jgi:leucyl-tRNA synthetase
VNKYGVDAERLFILFIAPPELDADWTDKGIEGMSRYVNRVWRLFNKFLELKNGKNQFKIDTKKDKQLEVKLHETIKKVTESIENNFRFNTSIASLMELTNSIQDYMEDNLINLNLLNDVFEKFILILAPFAPFLSEEMWERLSHKKSVHLMNWPSYDEKILQTEIVELIIEIDGKVRGRLIIDRDKEQKEIEKLVLDDFKIKKYLMDKKIKKIIYIKNKLINIVTE